MYTYYIMYMYVYIMYMWYMYIGDGIGSKRSMYGRYGTSRDPTIASTCVHACTLAYLYNNTHTRGR